MKTRNVEAQQGQGSNNEYCNFFVENFELLASVYYSISDNVDVCE